MTNPVEIVTIATKSPLFKKGTGESATAIELINFLFSNGDECGFNVVSQKDLYQIGDLAIYIQPDYCVPETELFSSFTAPYGDPNKSKLGKNGRIRAIKFNFNLGDSSDPIYSNGILLPLSEVGLPNNSDECINELFDIAEFLGITKYEEPERFGTGNAKGNFPSFLYKTGEENAANLKSHINRILEAGERIGWTLKIDGSSFTQYFKKGVDGWTTGICSRTLEKKLPENLEDTSPERRSNDSDPWVKLSISSGLYEKGMKYCQDNDRELVFRAEIYGEGLKSSGNKINPHSAMKPSLSIFGIDSLETGFATKLLPKEVEEICFGELPYLGYQPFYSDVSNYDGLIVEAKKVFDYFKNSNKWTVEGIVVRSLDSNKLSVKVMNEEYDSKK